MKHQQAITIHRVEALQAGINQANKLVFNASRILEDKDELPREEINTLKDELDEIQAFLDWLIQR